MKRRFLALLMAIIMIVSVIPLESFAASDGSQSDTGEVADNEQSQSGISGNEITASGSNPVTYSYDRQTGKPTDLGDEVYLAVYNGDGFPGEPAVYPYNDYTYFNENFGTRPLGNTFVAVYASSAEDVLKPEILDILTQGPTNSDGTRVWGYYNATGTKSYFLDGSALLDQANEKEIIEQIKADEIRRGASADDYEIIWYVIKFQTDTYWHIDGLVVEKETYHVNYYGNGNTSGDAPLGSTGLKLNDDYRIRNNRTDGDLAKVITKDGKRYEYTFTGWNTQPDGSGDSYTPDEEIQITGNLTLYAQWEPPMTDISVTKVWNDANNQDGIRPEELTIHLLANGDHVGDTVTLNAANSWTASWTVPLVDSDGNFITYAVEETVPTGYTCVVTGSEATGFTLTNTHVVERTSVQVQKVWTDDHDRDGIRPYGVVVQLYCNGEPVTSYTDSQGNVISGIATLTNETSWTQQWMDLEKNQANEVGTANVYSVVEIGYVDAQGNSIDNPGYTVAYDSDETNRLVVENIHQAATMDIPVSKVWNDENNRDGIRPGSVTVELYADGIATGLTLTLNESNGWKGTFEDVYVNAGGSAITYSIVESTVAGYEAAVTGSAANGFTVTNTHVPETVSVPAVKVWDDKDDQDGIRPDSVTVELYADGAPTGKALILTAANDWSGSFDDLPKHKEGSVGVEIVYTIKESSVPDGYTSTVSGSTVTNTHTPETADLNVQKVWNDANNQDGVRPDAVIITLHANGQPTAYTVTLDGTVDEVETEAWKAAWADMPRYHDGQRISYTVVETGYIVDGVTYEGIPAGYTVTHSYDTSDPTNPTATVTNSYTPEKTALNVQKVWDDEDNRAGKRPESITVTLMRKVGDGEWESTSKTAVLNADNEWDADFTDLPKYQDGQKISYSVVETALDPSLGYEEPVYILDESTGVVIVTNTRIAEKISVSVSKEWDDANNQDGIQPGSVTVTLYANGVSTGESKTLSAENGWSASFTDLFKHYHGKVIDYSIVEASVDGYTTTYAVSTDADGNVTVTVKNTHEPETVSVPVTKVWADANDQDGIRPGSVTVTLYAGGVAVKTMPLSADSNWTGIFEDLPKYKEGQSGVEIVYTVGEAEADVPAGYTATVNGNTITNTHTPEMTSVKVRKDWDDEDDQDGIRPDKITLHLYANGHDTEKTVTVTPDADGNWSYEWTGLNKYEEGKQINYTVYEELTAGSEYSASYSREDGVVVITNSYSPEKTAYTVQKVWDDTNNQDNVRYAGVAVQLYANGTAVGEVQILTAEGNWRYTWSGIDKNADGEAIAYTVEELYYIDADNNIVYFSEDADGYTDGALIDTYYDEGITGVLDTYTGIAIITNTHTPETTSVSVLKIWDDEGDQDGIRPDSITVTLYRNGVSTGTTAELNEGNRWSYTFTDLPVHHGIGVDNIYAVAEGNVPAGYTSETTGDANSGFTVTNTHTPETVSVPVSKVWADGDDQDGIRPDSITVTLYADGGAIDTLVLSADSNWAGSFDNLPKYKAGSVGVEIVYTVGEADADVPAGYEATVNGNIITNTHDPELADLNVRKVWDDANNQDGKRPYAVVITLYENGTPTDNVLILNDQNGWSGTWSDMPRYHSGQRISYTVVETGYYATEGDLTSDNLTAGVPEGYTVTHSYDTTDPNSPTATVTNTYSPETTSLNVQKVWDDDDNRAGKRPESITVTLMRKVGDGEWESTGKTAVLSPENEWDADFTDLPKYQNGQKITYDVVEASLDAALGYEAPKYDLDETLGVLTITNTRKAEKVELSVTKEWVDGDDQDGIRPEGVTVTLHANGIDTGWSQTLNETNNWTATFGDLYKFYTGDEVIYSIVEVAVDGYSISYDLTTDDDGNVTVGITNTHIPETVSIPVAKTWVDNDDQDGIRSESITATLYANDRAVKTIVLDAAGNWQGTFGDLPVYENGEKITYRVEELAIDGYSTAYTADSTVDGVLSFGIVNTHETEKTTLTAIKVWDDNDDQDGLRPDSITVHLLSDGVHTGKTVEITEAMDWTYTWTDLDKYADGQLIRYTVYEEPVYLTNAGAAARVIDTYTASYVRNPDDPTQITITNSYTPETTVITAMKVWEDGADRDGLRPDSITVELYADGTATGKTLVLSEENAWVASWTDLPKYQNHGVQIVYSVAETEIPDGYEVTVVQETEFAPGLFILTNTHAPATTGVSVQKIWNDENDNDGTRPDGIIVQLYANGSAVDGATVVLSEDNRWSYTWTHIGEELLYVFKNGEEISYYVDEIGYVVDGIEHAGLPQGYTKQTAQDSYQVNITNTRQTEKTSVTVAKVWNDAENSDGLRPASVSITLYRNGEAAGTAVLDESNGWTYTWTNLYKYVAGEMAEYTVEETAVAGYEATYTESTDSSGGILWTVTNTHEAETKTVTVSKVWVDDNDSEGMRPETITVQLRKDGKIYGEPIILSETNGWKCTVTLPVYENGKKIVWTVEEPEVPQYYGVTYNQNTLTVTNTMHYMDNPKTGDSFEPMLWMSLMLLSCAGAAALLVLDSRKKRMSA